MAFIYILTAQLHHPIHEATRGIEMNAISLVTSSPRLSNHALELINLGLSTAESTELFTVSFHVVRGWMPQEHTRFLASLRARLSLLFRSNSITRRSYGARLRDTTTISTSLALMSLSKDKVHTLKLP